MEWILDALCLLLLCIGTRIGQPRLLRVLCGFGLIYFVIFMLAYFFWLNWKFQYFLTHPDRSGAGISAAFAFEGFWQLFSSMLLLQGVLPIALVFLIYFSVRWLSAPMRPGSRYY